jgi:hypothetical protein
MDTRKLAFGLAIVFIIAGVLLALFTPGGLLNSGGVTESFQTPFGSVSMSASKSSAWPVVGYVLIGVGAVAAVVAFALNSPPKK